MVHALTLATTLDHEMLEGKGVTVASFLTPDTALPPCADLVDELGGRFLLKYIRNPDRYRYSILSGVTHFPGKHFATPTAICPEEIPSALNLPPLDPPTHVLVLDPSKIQANGPRAVRFGKCVEYVLLNGFSVDAIIAPGWPVQVI